MIDVQQERALSSIAVLAGRLAPLASHVRAGRPAVVQGVLDAARPWVVRALPPATCATLVVVADALTARTLHETLQALDPDGVFTLLPERDPLPFEWLTSDPTVTGSRLSALLSLSGAPVPHDGRTIVASTRALLQATIPPDVLVARRQRWLPGDRLRLASVLTSWMALGYDAVGVVEEPGTFCRRGGVLDVFPSHSDFPIRVELFDDEIESLHAYDPITQRSQERVDELVLLPAREGLPDRGPQVADRLSRLDASGCREDVQARWEESLQELREGRSFDGIELFLGHLHPPVNGFAYLPPDARVVLCDVAALRDMGVHLDTQTVELAETSPSRGDVPVGLTPTLLPWSTCDTAVSQRQLIALESGASIELERGDVHDAPRVSAALRGCAVQELAIQPPPEFGGQMQRLLQQCARWSNEGWQVLLATLQHDRLEEIFTGEGLQTRRSASLRDDAPPGFLALVGQQLWAGWMFPGSKLVVLSDVELFGPQPQGGRHRRHRGSDRTTAAFLADLNVGDLIVHVDHGIGRFSGITRLDQGAGEREYLLLEYAGADRLYVPTDQLDRVSRYVGVSEAPPSLNKLGTSEWSRVKSRVKAAVQEVAQGLLRLYAQRLATPGFTFPPDTGWQAEMEAAFPFDETPDQIRAIADVKSDLESGKIMDRLVCGDVGYGKTEVALRAAFKAVSNSKQVAILVPTTVLAQQHERTFRERLAAFPVQVAILSRFQTAKEQQATVDGLATGTIDIVIGTHRLLQKDVRFKELGLLVVDEEQRFGVAHKELLKQLRADVHVLTLTATPIPRTLNMALVGVRDMSVIETPPEERQPVKTYIGKYDDRLVRDAILRELDRGGQVFVVHNRVQSIPLIAAKITELVPEARVAIAHGQMREDKLEKVMLQFSAGEFNVLVCTTIIENGLDISNVNTIVINQATHLGLAQLYQLRGRVGRSNRRAYAYLLYSHEQRLPPLAEKRLRAVFEASELGAGFRIAMKDLEIRGAGNLLGADQHGHVAIIGFDLYTRMLEEAVQELKGTAVAPAKQVVVDLRLAAFLPDDYVTDPATKIDGYRRLALATTLEDASALREEFTDRFGPPPEQVRNLLDIVEIKALCLLAGISAVSASPMDVSFQFLQKRDYPRSTLIRRFGSAARLGSEQLRLPRARLGDAWVESLKEVLRMLC